MSNVQLVLGVDVGLTGAVAILSPDGELHAVFDIPTDLVRIGRTHRPRLAYAAFWEILCLRNSITHAYVEIPQGRPIVTRDKATGARAVRTPGAAGMLALGETVGATRMACAANGIIVHDVFPGIWMRAMRVDATKDTSRHMAAQLFPVQAYLFRRVKDHNRAQAALLGLYGVQQLQQGKA